jgi:hypothetical protein
LSAQGTVFDTDGNWQVFIYDDSLDISKNNTNFSARAATSLSKGSWEHVALTFASGTVRFFVNGQLEAEKEMGASAFNRTDDGIKIGEREYSSASNDFKGKIDEFRLYNRALSKTEIQQLYGGSDGETPAAPTDLSVTAGDGRVNLSWSAGGSNVPAGYNIYRSTSSFSDVSNATKVNASLLSETTYADTGLNNGTTYHYRVTAVSSNGNESKPSGEVNKTPRSGAGNLASRGWTHRQADVAGSNFSPVASPVPSGELKVQWSVPLPNRDANSILSGDVDEDGDLEVVTVQDQTLIIVSPDGSVELEQDISVSGYSQAFVTMLEDASGDGTPEIAVSYWRDSSNQGAYLARFYSASGELEKEFKLEAGADFGMEPAAVIDGDVIVGYDAGFAGDPRGFGRWDYDTATEVWRYDLGPRFGQISVADVNSDGMQEMAYGNFTPHNGASGNGTDDGSNYTVVLDEDGNVEVKQLYPGSNNTDGNLRDHFIRFKAGESYKLLSFKGHSSSYPGTSRIHLRSLDGTIEHTFTGADDVGWNYGWADLDGDGTKEIVASNGQGDAKKLYVLDPSLEVLRSAGLPSGHRVQALTDADGDGSVEIVVSGPSSVSIYSRSLELEESWTYSSEQSIRNVIASDNDGDGRAELAALSGGEIVVLEGQDRSSGDLIASSSKTVDSDGTVDFGNTSTRIDFSGVSGSGEVSVKKYGSEPNGVDGISESNVSSQRVVIEESGSLSFDDNTKLYLAVSGFEGIGDPSNIRIYKRSEEGTGSFSALVTSVNENGTPQDISDDEVYATLGSFSEFALASDTEPLPVELAQFSSAVQNSEVILKWQTVSETNNAGFEVQRQKEDMWEKIGFVDSKAEGGTTTETLSYSFAVEKLPVGTHRFRLKQINLDGSSTLTNPVSARVQMEESLRLSTPAPNPVSNTATLSFVVKEQAETRITLYNTLGQKVATVYRGTPQAKERQIVQLDAGNLSSGSYFLRMESGGQVRTEQLAVVH